MKGTQDDILAAAFAAVLGPEWKAVLYEPSEGDPPEVLPRLVASTTGARLRLILGPTLDLERPCLVAFTQGAGLYLEISQEEWGDLEELARSEAFTAPATLQAALRRQVGRAALDLLRVGAHVEALIDTLGPLGLEEVARDPEH